MLQSRFARPAILLAVIAFLLSAAIIHAHAAAGLRVRSLSRRSGAGPMPTLAKQLEALGSQLGRHQRKLTNIQKDIRRLRAQVAELSSNRSSSPGGDHGGDLAAAAVTIISNLAAITAATPSGQGWASKPPLLLPLTAGGGSWTPLGNLSEGSVSGAPFRGRSDHGMVAHGKYVYVIGGYGTLAGGSGSSPGLGSGPGSEVVLDEMIRYDTETGLWELMARMPERRCRFATALLGDAIYVIAGTALAGFQGGPSDSVLVYNITADTWTVGPRLVAPRIDACAAALDDKVYVFGGYDPAYVSLSSVEVLEVAGTGGSSGSGAGAARGNGSASVWRLLPQDSWMTEPRADCRAVAVTPPPLPRKPTTAATASPSYSPAPATATAAPVIVVAGGVQYFTPANKSCDGLLWVNCYRMLRSVHVFDPRQALLAASTGTGTGTGTSSGGAAGGGRGWRALAPMLWPRADFGLAVLPGGRLLAAGGEWGNGISFQLARQQVEEFSWGGPGGAGGPDAARGVWVAKAPLPEARFRTELVYVGGGAAITLGGVPTCGRTPNGRMADADACYRKYSATGFTYHDDRYAAAAATAALAQSSLDVAGGGGLMGSEDADDAAGAREAVEAVTALLPQLFAALHNDTRGNL